LPWRCSPSSLSRWRHGFESRWGCSLALTPFGERADHGLTRHPVADAPLAHTRPDRADSLGELAAGDEVWLEGDLVGTVHDEHVEIRQTHGVDLDDDLVGAGPGIVHPSRRPFG
jgi:hypothetical protein